MTENIKVIARRPRRRLPEIPLPDGDTAIPRVDFAHNVIGSCERSVTRMDLPTILSRIAVIRKNPGLENCSRFAARTIRAANSNLRARVL